MPSTTTRTALKSVADPTGTRATAEPDVEIPESEAPKRDWPVRAVDELQANPPATFAIEESGHACR